MSLVFGQGDQSARGKVHRFLLPADQAIPALMVWGDLADGGEEFLLSKFEVSESVLAQVAPMIGDSIYVCVMNDNPADIRVSGIAFRQGCQSSNHGINRIQSFYSANKASRRSTPSVLVIGNITFRGILLGISYSNEEPAMGMIGFQMTLKMRATDPSNG